MKWVGTPLGAQDRLFDACRTRRTLEAKTVAFLEGRGYREVMTPALELYDLFAQTGHPIPPESMFKLTDRDGRLLVMRPDSTTPMARVMASKLSKEHMPLRLFYLQDVFRSDPAHTGQKTETRQAGIELFGADGLKADLEVLALGAGLISALCPRRFHIELGHAALFSGLVSALPLDAEEKESLRRFIEQKNFAALGDSLSELSAYPAAEALGRLSLLSGGREVFSEAGSLGVQDAEEGLSHLQAVFEALDRAGMGGHFFVDLGLVHQLEYYSGLIFRGYVEGIGRTVLTGGRYNHLLDALGKPTSAIGFAIDIDALCDLMIAEQETPPVTLFHFSRENLGLALRLMNAADPGTCLLSQCETWEETLWLARTKNYARVLDVETGREVVL